MATSKSLRGALLGAVLAPCVPGAAQDDLRAEVESLWERDVAWRRIAWQPCLIDGLAASRRAGKPLAVWVFIDRPVDDKRC